jgi:PIN domain nuclease of toxin-antitoxin system
MQTFLDTHAWVWWVTGDKRLSSSAQALITTGAQRQGVWISVISIWEVAKKVEKGQLVLDRPLRSWMEAALAEPGLLVAELTQDILIDSCELPKPFHGDPADQMIVATVRHHRGRLVTKDAALSSYPHLVTFW